MVQICFDIYTGNIIFTGKRFNRSKPLVVNMNGPKWTVHASLQSTGEKPDPFIFHDLSKHHMEFVCTFAYYVQSNHSQFYFGLIGLPTLHL